LGGRLCISIFILIDWCLMPTLAIFQLYCGVVGEGNESSAPFFVIYKAGRVW
jgi:hypothetical protein